MFSSVEESTTQLESILRLCPYLILIVEASLLGLWVGDVQLTNDSTQLWHRYESAATQSMLQDNVMKEDELGLTNCSSNE